VIFIGQVLFMQAGKDRFPMLPEGQLLRVRCENALKTGFATDEVESACNELYAMLIVINEHGFKRCRLGAVIDENDFDAFNRDYERALLGEKCTLSNGAEVSYKDVLLARVAYEAERREKISVILADQSDEIKEEELYTFKKRERALQRAYNKRMLEKEKTIN